jgi:hypothetical protein
MAQVACGDVRAADRQPWRKGVIVHGADNPELDPELPEMDPAQVEEYLLSCDPAKVALALRFCYFMYIIPFYLFLKTRFQEADAADACCEALLALIQRITDRTLMVKGGVRGLLRVIARRAAGKRQMQKKLRYGRYIDRQVSIPVDRVALEELLAAIRAFVPTMPASEQDALLWHIEDVFGDTFDADVILEGELEPDIPGAGDTPEDDLEKKAITPHAKTRALSRARQRLEGFLETRGLYP